MRTVSRAQFETTQSAQFAPMGCKDWSRNTSDCGKNEGEEINCWQVLSRGKHAVSNHILVRPPAVDYHSRVRPFHEFSKIVKERGYTSGKTLLLGSTGSGLVAEVATVARNDVW